MMDKNNFKSIWKSSSVSGLVNIEQASLLHHLSSEISRVDESIRKRNILEKTTGIFLILVFGIIAYLVPYTLTKIASLLMVPFTIFYLYKIEGVRKQKEIDFSQSPKKFLKSQKKYLQKEKHLLDTVLYWAILPFTLIIILFYAGFPMDPQSYVWYGGFTGIILLVVYWANKYVVKNTFSPLLKNLDQLILELDEKDQPSV